MDYADKKIGIWGFGATGKSLLHFFSQHNAKISILDAQPLSLADLALIQAAKASLIDSSAIISFLQQNDSIVASPGVDIRPYAHIPAHYVAEIDIFADSFHKPVIAITGSIGKTSIVTLLEKILLYSGKKIAAGGNSGTPMLTLLDKQLEGVILELSSFQLALSKRFSPDLAIITNLYPNHLDRHGTIENYLAAKLPILIHQYANQQSLLPLNLHSMLPHSITHKETAAFFYYGTPTTAQYNLLKENQVLYYLEKNSIIRIEQKKSVRIYTSSIFSTITYRENWLIIGAILDLLKIPLSKIDQATDQLSIPDHRVAYVGTVNGIHFYNDSKSTIGQTTIAAVERLSTNRIILFLGGISKGTDREKLVKELSGKVAHILCFGHEAAQLASWCAQYAIAHSKHATLEDAFDYCLTVAQPGDTVLLSPAGASYDLFNIYTERGDRFKALVKEYQSRIGT